MSEVVGFSYRNSDLPEAGNLSGRMPLFDMLRQRGIKPLISLNAEAAFVEEGVMMHTLEAEQQTKEYGYVGLDSVNTIVNRLDRSVKKDSIPHPELLPSMINENQTRSLAFRKHLVDKEVLEPLGINIPSVLATDTAAIHEFLEAQPHEKYVVKPNSGSNGQNVYVFSSQEVEEFFLANPGLYATQLLQPAYDFTQKFPAAIRPYNTATAEAFDGWNREGIKKELRIYGFHSPTQTNVYPISRAIHSGADEWFFVDPESVPEDLLDKTKAAMTLAAQVSGAAAMHGTVDFGYGAPTGETPLWSAIELNGKAPYILGYDRHYEIADRLRTMFADQIAETATNYTKKVQ